MEELTNRLIEAIQDFTKIKKIITSDTTFSDLNLQNEIASYESLLLFIEEEMKTSISDDYANDIIDNPSEYKIQDLAKYIQNGIED